MKLKNLLFVMILSALVITCWQGHQISAQDAQVELEQPEEQIVLSPQITIGKTKEIREDVNTIAKYVKERDQAIDSLEDRTGGLEDQIDDILAEEDTEWWKKGLGIIQVILLYVIIRVLEGMGIGALMKKLNPFSD